MIFDSRVCGIPCQIEVTYYVNEPARLFGRPEDCYPAEFDVEYNILDRKGYRAEWLERKVKPSDEQKIIDEIVYHMSEPYDPY